MSKIRVGVLRGGPSREYDVSLKTGSSVLSALDPLKYDAYDILITREGTWHFRGRPIVPHNFIPNLDVVVNALHGEYGEDGQVQRFLSPFNIPYTGSHGVESAICMNKAHTKEALKDSGILMARHHVLEPTSDLFGRLEDIEGDLQHPYVVKPLASGSSVGVEIAYDLETLLHAVEAAFEHGPRVLVEEYISGREATCGVVEDMRGEAVYSLLPVEIIPDTDRPLFDYEAKYEGKSREICPANFDQKTSQELERLARLVHTNLGLRHYSRSDFIVAPSGIYFLEVNTLPGLTKASLIPKSLQAIGVTLPQFIDHVIMLALRRK